MAACGAHGASSFGAGFGGAVWAIVDTTALDDVQERLHASYRRAFPTRANKAEWFAMRPAAGVRWLT